MGTTQRMTPGVSGEPNWDNLSQSVTSIANTVAKEQEAEKEREQAEKKAEQTDSEANKENVRLANKRVSKLGATHVKHFKTALKNLVKTGGGSKKIGSGKSTSLGKAGLSSARKISLFFATVAGSGFSQAMQTTGIGTLTGKSVQEIVDYLSIYFGDSANGMDECAANSAVCQLMEELAKDTNNPKEFEEKLESIANNNNEITKLLCDFYGIYLFEHLSQRFQERITQLKGAEVSSATFQTIREDILEQVKVMHSSRNLSNIDWKGAEGKKIEEKIFTSIIEIFE